LLVFLRVIAERSCFTTRSTLFFKLRFHGARGSLSFERQSVFLRRHSPRGRVGVNDGACSNYTNSEVKRKTNLSLASFFAGNHRAQLLHNPFNLNFQFSVSRSARLPLFRKTICLPQSAQSARSSGGKRWGL